MKRIYQIGFIFLIFLISCHGNRIKTEYTWSENYSVGEIECKGCCRKHDRFDAATDSDKYYKTFYFRDIIQNYDAHEVVNLQKGDIIQFKLRLDFYEDGYSWNTIVGFKKIN